MTEYHVQLLGGFRLSRGGQGVEVAPDAQRLVAFLCLHDGPLPRSFVAGNLWLDGSEMRALGNLRSALWRLRRAIPDFVEADGSTVALSGRTVADVRELAARARRLWIHEHCDVVDLDHRPFAQEFLPGWCDEWVVVERERLRQLCLHSLETIADELTQRGMYGAAIQVLLTSIALDSLRESPRRRLVSIHLVEGNPSEAIREYRDYSDMLQRELGLQPSPEMRNLIASAELSVPNAPQPARRPTRRRANTVVTARRRLAVDDRRR